MMFIKHYAPNRCLCIKEAKLITGLRIAENGSYCENVKKGEKKSGGGGGGMCTKNGSYCEKEKKSVMGGGVRVDVNREVKLL